MKTVEIVGQKRQSLGANSAKSDRKNGFVPCVLYSAGKENVHFSVEQREFKKLIYTPNVHIAELNVDGNKFHAILKERQYHPVSDDLIHVDFLEVFQDKKITIEVPVKLTGFSVGVKEGGKLEHMRKKLKIRALMTNLPDEIVLNIEDLKVNQAIKVQDVVIPEVEMLDFKNAVVVTVKITRATAEGETAAEGGDAAKAPAAK